MLCSISSIIIMIRSYKGIVPTIPASCYVDQSAQMGVGVVDVLGVGVELIGDATGDRGELVQCSGGVAKSGSDLAFLGNVLALGAVFWRHERAVELTPKRLDDRILQPAG